MQQNYPFQFPPGASTTTNVAVTATSQTLTLPNVPMEGASLRLVVVGTQNVFVAYGSVTSSASTSMIILANSSEMFSIPGGVSQISVIAANTGSTIYATVGYGA